MKISCQSCQAKYTIADEKVVGKIVKIRCKKCGATIVINGNDPEATAAPSHDSNQVLDYTGSSNEQWTVNVAEGDQRTMTLAEITQEYRAGVVNDETFCWKDGMNDWLPIREIEALYAACTMGPAPALQAQSDFAPSSSRGFDDHGDHAEGGYGGGIFGSGAESNGNGAALFGGAPGSSATPSAARRSGGRGNNQADLFGTAAQAGGEDDVMTSAPVPPPSGDASKLTGQRNENSVLFSLNALTTNGPGAAPPPNQTTAKGDGSGLIDIRALSNAASVSDTNGPKTNKHVDDIMNLGGGGAFSAALAAPILAPPPTETGNDYGAPPQGTNKTLLYGIIGGCALLAVAIIVVAIIVTGSKKDDTASTSPTGSSMATTSPTTTAAPTATDTAAAAPTTSSTAAAPGTGAAVAQRPTTGGGGSRGTSKSSGGGGGVAANDTPAPPPAAPKQPTDLAGTMNATLGNRDTSPPPAAAAGGSAPFDRGAAAGSLGGVNVASCKKPDGPTGSGHVKVTFQPSGNVSTVEVDQPPFAGSSVGGCVAGKFRGAHVPPFAGGPVTVGKSFTIN